MAEKTEASISSQNLECPICTDIFVEATILPCGHTFCRGCLKEYDRSTQDNHMVCPVCRKTTKFTSARRVDDFPANVAVNGCVDDYHAKKRETRPKCTACRRQGDAVSFCKTCNRYLCEKCLTSHQEMCLLFEGHEIVPIEDIKGKEKKFKSADDPRLDLRSISRSDPKLEVIRCVDLRGWMSGMTRYSDDSVAIGYCTAYGIDIIDSGGNTQQYQNIPSDMKCWDLAFQQDRSLCISTSKTEAHIYSPNGSKKSTIYVRDNGSHIRLDRSHGDDIIIANCRNQVNIYDPTGSTLKQTVQTRHVTRQAPATRSGLIVTSSCNTNPSAVTVYDRDGNAGESLQAPECVSLYATVDEQDRVYVASVDSENDKVVIRLYDLDGLNLKEKVKFNALDMTLDSYWCYLVSLPRDMIAFACAKKLYLIKVLL